MRLIHKFSGIAAAKKVRALYLDGTGFLDFRRYTGIQKMTGEMLFEDYNGTLIYCQHDDSPDITGDWRYVTSKWDYHSITNMTVDTGSVSGSDPSSSYLDEIALFDFDIITPSANWDTLRIQRNGSTIQTLDCNKKMGPNYRAYITKLFQGCKVYLLNLTLYNYWNWDAYKEWRTPVSYDFTAMTSAPSYAINGQIKKIKDTR